MSSVFEFYVTSNILEFPEWWEALWIMPTLDHTWVYANEMTWDGGQSPGRLTMIRGLGFEQVIPVWTSKKGKGARDWVNSLCQYFSQSCICNETPMKTPESKLWGRFLSYEVLGRGMTHPNFLGKGHGSSIFSILPDLTFWDSPFGWSWFISFIIEPLTIGIVFSWVLLIILASYQTCRSHGNPQIYSHIVRSAGGLGTPKFVPPFLEPSRLLNMFYMSIGMMIPWKYAQV